MSALKKIQNKKYLQLKILAVYFVEVTGTINGFPMLNLSCVNELELLISMGTNSFIFGGRKAS